MKRNIMVHFLHIASIVCLLLNANLHPHGFSKTTKVHGNVTTYTSFKKLCYNVHEGTTQYVATYCVRTRRVDAVKRVVKSAESEHRVRVYVRLSCQQGYTKKSKDDIVCSIFQQFYYTDTNQWKMAGELKVGDSVLTKSGPKKLTYVDHVKKGHKIKLYMIEVEDTHLFYVGNDAVLTHNFMGLPVAVTLAVDVAFGTGTVAGASLGSFFGPVGITIGAAIGLVAGFIVMEIRKNQLPTFTVDAHTPVSHTVLYESSPTPEPIISVTPTSGFTPGTLVSLNNTDNMPSGSHDNSKPPIQNADNDDNKTPNDNDNDKNKKTAKMPDPDDAQGINHIFLNKRGHLPKSPENYRLLDGLVKNASNHIGSDQYGSQWFAKILENGKQLWARAHGGKVRSGGLNEIPKLYSPETGLLGILALVSTSDFSDDIHI
jgi:hypothetical protein